MDQYDPDVCITAGALRAMGATLDDNIPDCAWVPRHAMHVTFGEPQLSPDAARVAVKTFISITAPFRWISVTGALTQPQADS